jgi:transposase
MVADFKSERRPGSNRNPRPDCVGIRSQARTGRLALVTDGPAEFVEIELEQPSVRNETDAKIEIVVGKVVLRLEQDTASTRIAEIMTALERGA